ncbi:hypothetical protein EUGRSUZ_H02577 [Eucalyptus grandis]|uniref:Uncharacterized protein n=2 Tax=Eucalyptus grandis TaxID=71139 RepID=A0ACC3JSC1_EUCGR|nr:hypothetical protein EUGRSUZ_H02577 [Eucalyptus grandis]
MLFHVEGGRPLSYHDVDIGINITPLLSALIKKHLRVLLFSGDQDSKIPLTQTRIIANMIARDLKFTSLGKYAPWYNKKQEMSVQSRGRGRGWRRKEIKLAATGWRW